MRRMLADSAARRKQRKRDRLFSTPEVTGFLAVMIVLLFIFMYSPFDDLPRSISVDLARVRHPVAEPRADREDAMIVAVMRDGRIYFGSDRINEPSDMVRLIRLDVAGGAEHKVYVKADRWAKWGRVKVALDAIRAAGVEKVIFLVEGPSRRLSGIFDY